MLNKLVIDRYLDLPTFNQQAPPVNNTWPANFAPVANRPYNIAQSQYKNLLTGPQRVSRVTGGAHATKDHRTFRWLPWVEGKVSCVALAGGADILTGKMSGCWLTIFQYNGAYYAGHVGTSLSSTNTLTIQAKAAWRNAVNANHITAVAAFNPVAGLPNDLNLQKQSAELYGAWDSNRNLYTLVLAASMNINGGAQRRRIAKLVRKNTPPTDVAAF